MKDEQTPYVKELRAAQNAMMKVYADQDGDPKARIHTLQRHVRFIDGLLSAIHQAVADGEGGTSTDKTPVE